LPITARLSKRFYDRLGEEIANELVEWMNQVDAASRDELRALNELNYARFEAKLEQRTAELRAQMDGLAHQLGGRIDSLEARIERAILEMRSELQARLTEHARWMVLTWGVLLAAVIGLYTR
jgi:hypothetical protein